MMEHLLQANIIKMKIYNDPLHIHPDVYTVSYNGERAFTLNKRLLDSQNAWGNLTEIIEAHELKLAIYNIIHDSDDKVLLKSLAKDLKEIEFELQELWGFERDANFHRFWEYEKCECPKIDNMDSYPYQQYISYNCPLHGDD